jgi:hypothetical protein
MRKQNCEESIYEAVAGRTETQLAGLGLYCQALDGEEGPEIYVGATKEAQAKTLWNKLLSKKIDFITIIRI